MAKTELKIVYRKVEDLIPYARNARVHSDAQVAEIAASIKEYGWTNPILLDGDNGIIAGHGRLMAARKLGMDEVPTIDIIGLTDTQKRALILADNKMALNASWDEDMLKLELADLVGGGIDSILTGFSQEEIDDLIGDLDTEEKTSSYGENKGSGVLVDRYLVPPFSVLDTRQGYWQDRERKWDALIGDNGESRENTLFQCSMVDEKGLPGVSLFDPVLAEIICRWFLPSESGSKICDPFAGGMFGYVAAFLGNTYTGIELRKEQADLNNSRVKGMSAHYICDDGRNIAKHIEAESQDMVFSCPPYFDLEKYSDLPNDASNQTWEGFCSILHDALTGAMSCLKDNRFAVIVMSNVRDRSGFYLDICEEIKRTMAECGAGLYNEIILVNAVGTGAIRAHTTFRNRKTVRMHQEVLVFFKGNPKNIQKDFPVLQLDEEEDAGTVTA